MTPTARHRTHDKKYTNNYYPLTANVDPFLWRKSLHTFYIMPTMKKTEIIQVIFSLIVYQTTYQVPRVSVHISGNLCVCCKPQICCLTLRTASDILQRWRWIAPFRGKGAHQMGVCAGFAWCNPDLNGRTCAVLVCYFTYWWARRGSSAVFVELVLCCVTLRGNFSYSEMRIRYLKPRKLLLFTNLMQIHFVYYSYK